MASLIHRLPRLAVLAFLLLWPASSASAQDKVTYQDHVLPIFRNKCLQCHNPDKLKGDLNLSTFQGALKGSGNGAVLESGDPDSSFLYKAITHAEEPTMPPNDKLPDPDIKVIRQWIAGGLLETSGSKAVVSNKPKLDLSVGAAGFGKPEGPPPMPVEVLALDPYLRTQRASAATALAVSPWSPLIAIGGQRQVFLYNTDTLLLEGVIPFPEGFPQHAQFSASGKLLVIGGGRGANLGLSALWDITTGQRVMTVGDDLDTVLATDISPDQRFIAHGGPDRLVRLFSTRSGRVVHKIKKHTDWVTAVRFSPTGKYVATGDRNGGLHVWETEVAGLVCSLGGHNGRITGLEWVSTNLFFSISEDGKGKLWNTDEFREVKNWNAHGGGALSLARAQNGFLVTCGRDRKATLWDANADRKRDFPFPGDIPSRAVPSYDGQRVIGVDWNGIAYVWNAENGEELGRLSLNPIPTAEQFAAAQQTVAERETQRALAAEKVAAAETRLTQAETAVPALEAQTQSPGAEAGPAPETDAAVAEARKNLEAARQELATADQALQTARAEVRLRHQRTAYSALFQTRQHWLDQSNVLATVEAQFDQTRAARSQTETELRTLRSIDLAALKESKRNAIDQARQTEAGLRQQLTETTAALQTRQESRAAAQERAQQAAQHLAETTARRDAAQTSLNLLASASDEKAKALEAAQQRHDELIAQNQKPAEATLAQAAQSLETARARQTEAEQQLAALDQQIQTGREQITRDEQNQTAAQSAIEQARQAVDAFRPRADEAEQGFAQAQQQAQAAQASLDALLTTKHQPAVALVAALDRNLAETRQSQAQARQLLLTFESEAAAARQALEAAQTGFDASRQSSAALQTEVAALESPARDAAAHAKQRRAALDTATQSLQFLTDQKLHPLQSRIGLLQKQIEETTAARTNLEPQIVLAHGKVQTALTAYQQSEGQAQQAELEAARTPPGPDKERLEFIAQTKRAAADQAKSLLDMIISDEQKPLLQRLAVMSASLATTRAQLAESQSALVDLDAQLETAQTRVLTAESEVLKADEASRRHETALQSKRDEAARAEADLAQARSRRDQAQTALNHLVQSMKAPSEQALQACSESIPQLEASLRSAQMVLSALEPETESARQSALATARMLTDVDQQTRADRDRAVTLRQTLAQTESDLVQRNSALDESRQRLQTLLDKERPESQTRLAAARKSSAECAQAKSVAEETLQQALAAVAKADQDLAQARQLSDQARAERDSAQSVLADRVKTMDAAAVEAAQFLQRAVDEQAQLDQAQARLTEVDQAVAAAGQSVKDLELDLAATDEQHARALEKLTEASARQDHDLASLSAQLDQARVALQTAGTALEQRRSEYESLK